VKRTLWGLKKKNSSSFEEEEEEEESLTSVDFFCTQNSAQLGLCLSCSLTGPPPRFCGEEEEEAPDLPFCIAYLSIYISIFQQTCTTTTTHFLFFLETLMMIFVAESCCS
jgi:hypothetical protein